MDVRSIEGYEMSYLDELMKHLDNGALVIPEVKND